MHNVSVDIGTGKNTTDLVGWSFEKPNEYKVVIKRDGFEFHQLIPYTNWENFWKEFKIFWIFWSAYIKYIKPENVTRMGARFINIIDLPLGNDGVDLEDYFNLYPQIPSYFKKMNDFLMRVVIPFEKEEIDSIITQTLANSQNMSIVLDIDVFKQNLNFKADNEKEAQDVLEKLRFCKNELFERFITYDLRKELN